jgi:DNA ligase-associated metallophosphoesterase
VSKGKQITLKGTRIMLLPEKAVWLPATQTLLVADWHLGKARHFRKEGIYMPPAGMEKELDRLQLLMEQYRPEILVFLGDLFHSSINSDWNGLCSFLARHSSTRFILTKGNHDILPEAVFKEAAIEVMTEYMADETLICTHAPLTRVPAGRINIAGHVHPGCVISTRARMQYRLPCFYYYRRILLLPAFGELTGLCTMACEEGARFFPVLHDEVMEWTDHSG